MSVYTKKGDQGFTSLLNGKRVQKNHELIIISGKIDSLQASIDTASIKTSEKTKKILTRINEELWILSAEASNEGINNLKKTITQENITQLEKDIDENQPKNNYFIRFTKESSTRINEARVRTRELEITITKLFLEQKIRQEIYEYVNRLSDLLYVLACEEEKEQE